MAGPKACQRRQRLLIGGAARGRRVAHPGALDLILRAGRIGVYRCLREDVSEVLASGLSYLLPETLQSMARLSGISSF